VLEAFAHAFEYVYGDCHSNKIYYYSITL
jgi:hypothetical protein